MAPPEAAVVRAVGRRAAILIWIAFKLLLVSAMINQNVTQFIYAGF